MQSVGRCHQFNVKSLEGESKRDVYIDVDGNLLCMRCNTGNDKANRNLEEMRKYQRNIVHEANLHFVDLLFFLKSHY